MNTCLVVSVEGGAALVATRNLRICFVLFEYYSRLVKKSMTLIFLKRIPVLLWANKVSVSVHSAIGIRPW